MGQVKVLGGVPSAEHNYQDSLFIFGSSSLFFTTKHE